MATFYSSDWHSAPNGGAKYRLALTCTVASQNVAANTSTINWVLTIQKDRSYRGFYDYPANTRVRIDGVIVYDWDSYPTSEWPGWSEWTLASGSRTITHNSDGTRTFIVGAAWQRAASGWSPGSFDVSGTMVLPTIARATTPTVTPSPAATGAAVKISLPRASSAFTHDVTWASGTMSGTIGTGLATEATWIVPNVMGEFPGQSRAPITITVVTKNGATVIGSRQVTLQATEPPMAPEIKHLTPDQEYDIRAREVTWDTATNEWKRGRILPTDSISMVDPSSATTTCSITMSKLKAVDFPDHSIIDIDVFDGENWRFTNHRFVLSRIEGDAADPSETYTYSGTEYIDYMLGFAYVPTDYKWTGASGEFGLTSAGNLVHYCIFKAKERGWGPRMGIGFDWAKTSFGDPWMNTNLNRTVSKGTPVSQVLDGMVNDGYVEYSTEYHTNQAWLVLLNPGTGASFADVGASPVVNLGLAELTRAPRRGTSEKRLTRVTVVGDVASGGKDPITATRERAPFDPDVFGHLEGWVSASGVKSGAEVGRIGDNALRDNASVVNERTFEYDAQGIAPQFRPYVVFKPGDWVLIPTDDGPITDRISQITISKTKDSKKITVLTGDRILSGVASLAKRQSAQTGGAIGGGNGTTPSQLDDRIPAAPIIDTVTSVGYWTTDGSARSEITVKWAPVTEAMSGSGIDIDIYEVWWREAVGGVWKFRAATSDTEIDMPDWEVLKNYELRVRARSAASVFGEFSENIEHTTPEPAVDLDGPILSDLYTDGLGNIYASWDGTLGGVPAPNRVGYIAAEVSSDGGTVYAQMGTPITAMGTIVVAPGSYGEFKIRLRAFDGLGNPGDASLPQTITTENPHINEIVTLSSTTQALASPPGGGATTPATAVITGTATNTTITSWEYSADGAAFSATVPAGVSRNVNVVTITGAAMTAKTIAVRMADAHGKFDVITIAKLADGADGADGRGISSTEVRYQVGTSGTSAPTGSWLTAPPATTAGQYLWTRTVTNYTDSTNTTAYSVARHGATGASGVGITGTVVNYAVGASGTSAPSSGWGASIPAVTAGQFLWTRTVTSYTSGDPTTAYAVGKMGDTGAAGTGISGTEVRYQVGTSGTTAPTGSWLATVPATTAGQYLWTRTITSYTAGANTTAYSVAAHGATGAAGVGISGTEVRYQASTSGTTAPTGTWLASVPATVTGQFLWTRTVTSYTSGSPTTAYSVAAHGATGATGNGVTGSTVRYQIGTSGTTAPTGTWLTTIPSTVSGQFLWTRTVTSYTTGPDTTAYSVAAHGGDGRGLVKVEPLFKAMENLAPSLYGPTVAVKVRRNRATRPLPHGDWTASYGSGGAGSITTEPIGAGGRPVRVMSWSAVPGSGGRQLILNAPWNRYPVAAGEVITLSIDAGYQGVVAGNARLKADWYNGGTYVSNVVGAATPVSADPTSLTRLSATVTVPLSGVTHMTVTIDLVTIPTVGAKLYADRFMIGDGDYLDGNTKPSDIAGPEDFTIRWLGAANESEAVLEGQHPVGFIDSKVISIVTADGAKLRQIPTEPAGAGGADAFTRVDVAASVLQDAFTVAATLTLSAPLSGGIEPRGRKIVAYSPEIMTKAAPNVAGTYPLRLEAPARTSIYQARLYHGGRAGSGDVYWSNIGVFAGTQFDYTTWQMSEPLFDKNMELWRVEKLTYTDGVEHTEPTRVTSWDGVADAQDNTVTNQTIQYAVNTSTTTAPTSGWVSTQPSRTAGQVIWMRVVITYGDGGTSTSAPAVVTGDQGNAGNGVTGSTVTYQVSSSGTTTPTGTWNSSVPSVPAGQFLWTRTIITYSNATTTTTYSVARAGADGAAAYTVILSNESHTFPGTASAAVAGSTTSRVFAYKGATASAATVGTITGAPTGMTTSVSGNGTTAPIITINVAATLVTQSGVLTVPITVDGVTFSKSISWAVAWSLVGAKEPLPPTAVVAVAGAGWDASGFFPDAWFDVSWTAPTTDISGGPIEIAGYDLWGKRTDEAEMRFLTSVAAPTARVAARDGEEWSFQVCATSTHGARSSLTPAITSTANATTAPAPAPGVPSLDQYAGLLRIKWSGAGMLPQIKTVYATIASSASGPYTRAGMPLTGAGEVVVPGLAPAQYWAKIVMVDERGAISTSAAAGPIQLLPITGVTIQTSPVANTGIKITDAALTAYDVSGNPTFIVDATTGEVWIAPFDSVFEFGASGTVAETGAPTVGVQISSEGSSFNTFIHSAGVQIRNDQTPLSWWEADASDASLVNFVAPRARVDNRFKVGDYEFLREAKAGGKGRLVIRYQGS